MNEESDTRSFSNDKEEDRSLMKIVSLSMLLLSLVLFTSFPLASAQGALTVSIRLPERFRVLTDQLFDLRIEAVGLTRPDASLHVLVDGAEVSSAWPLPEVTTDNDADNTTLDKAWTFRKVALSSAGVKTLQAVVSDGTQNATTRARIGVQPFRLQGKKSILLFLGDAMGTAYRDAARIVAKSTNQRFREGFFDELLQMDQLPVTGMVMTYALDRVVPDSANTANAWSTGNKTIDGALGVLPDNTDFRFDSTALPATKRFALDNPRVETLWEYLKRRYGYKTGIVTTADVTDATPAGAGAHTITRLLSYDIAKQYVDGVFLSGPTFDVIMGGGKERFVARTEENSGDTRNLAAELQALGYTYVQTRTELNALPGGASAPDKVLGLFRTGNMNVAYDKLGLTRPADEPAPDFEGFTDQPFLDEMTIKALATLSKQHHPFILLVEGASIDKQSHFNHAAGQIWDTIELDKAVGIGRSFLHQDTRTLSTTLLLVTADHDQSLSLLGVTDTTAPGALQNVRSNVGYPSPMSSPPTNTRPTYPGESEGFPDYTDADGDGYPENTNRFRITVGYRSNAHTGSSVPLSAEGTGALLFTGYYDQTDLFFKIATVLSHETTVLDKTVQEKEKLKGVDQNY
jgi:alkaline phosphatase